MKPYIEIGKVINTHGVQGMVKVEPWCDTPSVLARMKTVYRRMPGGVFQPLNVLRGAPQGRFTLLHLEGCSSFEDAARLRGAILYAAHDDVPVREGAHLIDDLKGLSVIDEDSGTVYGVLEDVINLGASDLYEIRTPDGGQVLIPAVKQFIRRIDLEAGIFVTPIPGMFDHAD